MNGSRARASWKWMLLLGIFITTSLARCGDGNSTGPDNPPPPPPPTAAASIEVSGNGAISVHPSIDPRFGAAVAFPVRIAETGGGTAVWNFFRVSYFRNGVEIERNEQGADVIEAEGFRNIGARSSMTPNVITRVNSVDWDDVELRLGFIDNRDAREFEQTLSLAAFSGVTLDFTPAALPEESSFAIVESR